MYNESIMIAKARKNAKKTSEQGRSLDRKVRRRPELVVKAIADPKTRAKLEQKRLKLRRAPLTWREWAMLGILATCTTAVLGSFAVKASFHPERDAEKALDRLATAYYTEFLYPQILGEKTDVAEVFGKYEENGLPLVYLRQMYTFNEGKYAGEKEFFSNKYYECDENSSRVHFKPVKPYGESDFTYDTMLECERL